MKYSKGKIGRIFVVRFEHGDDFIEEIKKLASTEDIDTGMVNFMGAVRKAELVTGPEDLSLPPLPLRKNIDNGWEILGFGTILKKTGGHDIHFHVSLGRDGKSITGCLRKAQEVFITVEAVITEITGCAVKREHDEVTGMRLFTFDS